MNRRGTGTRIALQTGLLALSLAFGACAPREAPLTTQVQPAEGEAAPGWLPDGWARLPEGPWPEPEASAVDTYAPRGAAAPLVMTARYSAEQAATLRRDRPDLARWLTDELIAAMTLEGAARVGSPEPWARAGLTAGWRVGAVTLAAEGLHGELEGEVAVGQTAGGELLALAVWVPRGGERGLIQQVLADVPL